MTSLLRRADRWLFSPAPAERLAVLRILVGSFATVYLGLRLWAFLALTEADPDRFGPVGPLGLLHAPLPDGALRALAIAAPALGVAYTVGAGFRITGPGFSVALLVLTAYRSSWGQLLHFENLMVLQVLIVGLTAASAACSWDARRATTPPSEVRFGWPVRLAAVVTVITYVLAGVAKLRLGGIGWMLGDSLRHHVAYSAVRLEQLGGSSSPFGRALLGHTWVFPPLAVATVLIELAAPVALVGGRVRNAWVASAWALHASVALLMFVVFPFPLLLVAFAPFYRLERLPAALGLRRGGTAPYCAPVARDRVDESDQSPPNPHARDLPGRN